MAATKTKHESGLGTFDGHKVVGTGIAVTNAGDGLSQALEVDPRIINHGERVYVVLECDCTKVSHVPVDKDNLGGEQRRVHNLRAGSATIVDRELVIDALELQQKRIEEAKGVVQFDFPDGAEDDDLDPDRED